MFISYFDGYEVRPEFSKIYISLWGNWLGKENLHLLDKVSEEEWSRFNFLLSMINRQYKVGHVNCEAESINFPRNIEGTFDNFNDYKNKDASMFAKYIIPELDCVITEEWDYTYILWHKGDAAIEALKGIIAEAGLQYFSDLAS